MPEIGKEYGYLTVEKQVTPFKYLCTCRCGTECIVWGTRVDKGWSRSCGCRFRKGMLKHGLSNLPEYAIWLAMRQRCLNPNHPNFHRYGGRGITICVEWEDFAIFLRDMGYRPADGLSLERRDNNGPYSPENCYWATKLDQANNTSTNAILVCQGLARTVSQWARELGIKANTIIYRKRRGLSDEEALTVGALPWRNQYTKKEGSDGTLRS